MKKVFVLLTLVLAACTSHPVSNEAPAEKKGGFAVETHEPPMLALDNVQSLDNVQLFVRQVYFKPGSAKITPEGRKVLNGLMGMMQVESAYTVHIIGLADETEKNAKTLSMRRALSVAQLFRSAGIDPSRFRVNGQGQDLNLKCKKQTGARRAECLSKERLVILTNQY